MFLTMQKPDRANQIAVITSFVLSCDLMENMANHKALISSAAAKQWSGIGGSRNAVRKASCWKFANNINYS